MHLHAAAAFAAGLELVFIPFSEFSSSALCFLDGWWLDGLVMRILRYHAGPIMDTMMAACLLYG
jgi:hypothetical protein